MKNLLTACLPAVALLALGGCAGTSALTSTEDDGVYYSSKDRTSMVVSQVPSLAPATTSDEATNPDYNGGTTRQNSQGSGSDQYYDNTYTYMRGVPSYSSATYYGPGVNYYTPYTPYTSLNMGYGWGGAYGMSPFGYDPFYSPFYGYGSGMSISFGFGRPWGYGGFGGYGYSPYGYGYGGGFYDPFYYNSRFYGGYYGGGGYYGNNYYGGNYYYGNNYYGGNRNYGGGYANDNGRGRTSGHRTDRTSEGRNNVSSSGGVTSSGPSGVTGSGGGRVRSEKVSPNSNVPQSMPNTMANERGRVRSEELKANSGAMTDQPVDTYRNRPRQMDAVAKPQYRDMDPATNTVGAQPMQDQTTRGEGRGRFRTADAQPQSMPDQMQPAASQPQEGQRRRGGFFQNVLGEPINNTGRAADAAQPRQRTYDQPRQQTYSQPQQRVYEQPRQQTYEQPRQQTYEQPQRSSSQPSYSAPSYGGGGGGGGGRSRGRGE